MARLPLRESFARLACAGACAFLLLAAGVDVQAGRYAFVPLVDTAGPFASVGAAVINEDGAFAFCATPDGILARAGVYRSAGALPPVLLYQDWHAGLGIGGRLTGGPGIDDAGRVYYSTYTAYQLDRSSAIHVSDQEEPLREVEETDLRLGPVGRDGSFVFVHRDLSFPDPAEDRDVVHRARAGEPLVEIARGAPDAFGPLAFDGADTVAFRREGAPGSFEIQTADGDAVETVAAQAGPFACGSPSGCFSERVSIDAAGTVGFRARFDGGAEVGIFTRTREGSVEPWADTRGPFAQVGLHTPGSGPLAGGGGRIAFVGSLDAAPARYGIYTGPDPVADRVIGEGDPLLGSTVAELSLEDFNEAGQLAFVAGLEDGRQVLVRADPVPEPGAAAGALAAVAALAGLAQRGIRRTD